MIEDLEFNFRPVSSIYSRTPPPIPPLCSGPGRYSENCINPTMLHLIIPCRLNQTNRHRFHKHEFKLSNSHHPSKLLIVWPISRTIPPFYSGLFYRDQREKLSLAHQCANFGAQNCMLCPLQGANCCYIDNVKLLQDLIKIKTVPLRI